MCIRDRDVYKSQPSSFVARQTPSGRLQYGVVAVDAHSALLVQLPRQSVAPALQALDGQLNVEAAGQLPAPSHTSASVFTAAAQLGSRHVTAAPGYVHAFGVVATQVPAHVPVPLHAARAPCGGPFTPTHNPRLLPTSHA